MGRSASVVPPSSPIASRVAVLMALHVCLVFMLKTAESGALSLFLGHLGADKLPYSFLAISLVDVPLAFLYMRLARVIPTRPLLVGLGAILAVTLAVALGSAHIVGEGAAYFAAYAAATVLSTFIVIQWGVTLLELFTVEESIRAFPLVYVGAHGGSFLAGAALRQLTEPLGTENLVAWVPLGAFVLVVALVVVAGQLKEGRGWRQGKGAEPAAAQGFAALSRLDLLRTSPLLRAIAVATAIMVMLRLLLRFLYGSGFEQAFPDSDDLTRFIGTYTMVASACGIAMQVLVTPFLLRRLGVGLLNACYAYLVGLSFALSFVAPGLPAAIAGRATDQDIKSAIKTPLSPMFYEALGRGQRKQGRAVILGIVSPLTSFVSSLILVALMAGQIATVHLAICGAGLSVLLIVAAHLQGRAYHRALEQLVIRWHANKTGESAGSLEDALHAAVRSQDRRINDMARQVRRRLGKTAR